METVKIRVEYAPEDFIRAINYANNRSWFYRNSTLVITTLVFSAVLFMIAALQDPSDNSNLFVIWFVALVPALFAGGLIWILSRIFNPWYLNRTIKNQIRSSPLLQEANEIEFDRHGFEASTYLSSTAYKWEAFREVIETESDFHFLTSTKFTIFVPKSAFTDELEIIRVRQFVKEKLFDRALLESP